MTAPAGFLCYVDITVTNPTSPATLLSDFTLPLRFTLPAAKTLANGDDIRITYTDDTPIPYGLKTITTVGANRNYFVPCKPTSIPTTPLTVRVLAVAMARTAPRSGFRVTLAGMVRSSAILWVPAGTRRTT